jgi:Fur family transcriptional regulator, ferric uptake regulator
MALRRHTRQREAILRSISSADGPLSVAEIHDRSSRVVRGMGIATIYRGLRALREGGEVVAVELPGEETRYEPASRGHHHHFRCRSCERVYDLEVCPVGVPQGTTLPGGYTVEDHSLTLYGRCTACLT